MESCILRSDGTLLVWGYEGFGLRGDGIARSIPLPVLTPVTPVPGATKIALSGSTVLVRAPVVTMPNVVGALRVSAVAQLQAIGLSVQVSTVPDQPICNNVGLVESQTPPPGTVVAPGGHATIRVYVPPPAGRLPSQVRANRGAQRGRPGHRLRRRGLELCGAAAQCGTTITEIRRFTRTPILISETATGPVAGPPRSPTWLPGSAITTCSGSSGSIRRSITGSTIKTGGSRTARSRSPSGRQRTCSRRASPRQGQPRAHHEQVSGGGDEQARREG